MSKWDKIKHKVKKLNKIVNMFSKEKENLLACEYHIALVSWMGSAYSPKNCHHGSLVKPLRWYLFWVPLLAARKEKLYTITAGRISQYYWPTENGSHDDKITKVFEGKPSYQTHCHFLHYLGDILAHARRKLQANIVVNYLYIKFSKKIWKIQE